MSRDYVQEAFDRRVEHLMHNPAEVLRGFDKLNAIDCARDGLANEDDATIARAIRLAGSDSYNDLGRLVAAMIARAIERAVEEELPTPDQSERADAADHYADELAERFEERRRE